MTGARNFEAAVPKASPTHTKTDQESCFTRSATMGFRLGKSPTPAAKSSSSTSMAKPRRIASQAVRRRVAWRLLGAEAVGRAAVALEVFFLPFMAILLWCKDADVSLIAYPSQPLFSVKRAEAFPFSALSPLESWQSLSARSP